VKQGELRVLLSIALLVNFNIIIAGG